MAAQRMNQAHRIIPVQQATPAWDALTPKEARQIQQRLRQAGRGQAGQNAEAFWIAIYRAQTRQKGMDD